jgi:hypothetical protein
MLGLNETVIIKCRSRIKIQRQKTLRRILSKEGIVYRQKKKFLDPEHTNRLPQWRAAPGSLEAPSEVESPQV